MGAPCMLARGLRSIIVAVVAGTRPSRRRRGRSGRCSGAVSSTWATNAGPSTRRGRDLRC
eukprot:9797136-Alexandrium_andersonii.AAC.1